MVPQNQSRFLQGMSLDFQALEIADWIVWIKKTVPSAKWWATIRFNIKQIQFSSCCTKTSTLIQVSIQFLGKV